MDLRMGLRMGLGLDVSMRMNKLVLVLMLMLVLVWTWMPTLGWVSARAPTPRVPEAQRYLTGRAAAAPGARVSSPRATSRSAQGCPRAPWVSRSG